MTSSRRDLDDTAPATEVPSEPARRRSDTFIPPAERYQLGAEIGRGGMGRVVEAYDTKLGRTVALKEVLPRAGEGVERRFLREVRVTARLEHPSIVPLYDSGVTAEGRPFYVMRRVSGRPLDELIKRARGLDERLTLLPAVLRAIDAIAHAHKRGVIHRDLKPANIIVGEHGESVVIDWGLAKVIGEADPDEPDSLAELKAGDSLQTQYGAVFGTPGFMPPEQARGETLGFGGDVYALGATLYQLLAGAPPHQGSSVTDVMDRTLRSAVTPLRTLAPGAPIELAAIVDKALSYDADHRYRDASELAADVRRFEAGQLVAAHHYTPRQRVGRFVRRHRSLLVLGAIALSASIILGVVGFLRVVAERTTAQRARAAAEATAADLQAQTHELTLANAAALVSTNPTMALAYLKRIPAGSRFESRARGLAQSAFARGVGWAMEGPTDKHRQSDLSPSENRVLWQNLDSELRVYDLAERRLLLVRPVEPSTTAAWLDDDRILVSGSKPAVVDVRTGAGRLLDLPPVFTWSVADTHATALVRLSDGQTLGLDLDTGTTTRYPLPPLEGFIAISSSGAWSAVWSTDHVSFFDSAGLEIGQHHADVAQAVAMPDDSIVLVGYRGVYRCHLGRAPLCTQLDILRSAASDFVTLARRWGTELLVTTAYDRLHVIDGDHMATFTLPVTSLAQLAGSSRVPLGSDRDTIYLPTNTGWVPLDLPQVALRTRVTVGVRRTVAFGDGLITVFDTERWLPRRFAGTVMQEASYVDDATIVVSTPATMEGLDWRDADTFELVAHTDLPVPLFATYFTSSGSVLVTSLPKGMSSENPGEVLHVPRRSSSFERVTQSLGPPTITAFPDGTALVVRGESEVVVSKLGQAALPVMKLPGKVRSISLPDAHRFVALVDTDELVIGTPRLQRLERYPVPAAPAGSELVARDDLILQVSGRSVAIWRDRKFVPFAEFPEEPFWVRLWQRKLIAPLGDRSVRMLDLDTGELTTLFEPSMAVAWTNEAVDVVATFTKSTQVELLDLETMTRWNFPVMFRLNDRHPSLSPDGTRFLLTTDQGMYQWKLARVGPDYAAWLDGATNALIKDGKLTWDHTSKAHLAP